MARRFNTTDEQSTRRDLSATDVAILKTAERDGNVSIIERVENLTRQADSNARSQREEAQQVQARRARRVRHCRECGQTGHDRRNCARLQVERQEQQPNTQSLETAEAIDLNSPSGWTDVEELIDLTAN